MSFGFSVGDVILLSQLSLRVYQALTSGRKNASRELQELADVLFGFRCALDHLSIVADGVFKSSVTSTSSVDSQVDMRSRLDRMVRGCATTLQDLDSATEKYRDGAFQDDVDDGVVQGSPGAAQRANFKRRIAANVTKIRWDVDKDSLRMYRDKLQSHTDAINLVLNTFVWYVAANLFLYDFSTRMVAVDSAVRSNTEKIGADNKANAEKFSKLHDQVAASNTELTRLLETIVAATAVKSSPANFESSLRPDAVDSLTMEPVPTNTITVSDNPAHTNIAARQLPSHIEALNVKRMARATPSHPEHLKRPEMRVPTESTQSQGPVPVAQLTAQLDKVLAGAATVGKVTVTQWIRKLDRTLDSRIWGGISKKQNQDLVDILIHLNDAIDRADRRAREVFYESSKSANMDFVLSKIFDATLSVRARQQIEEFVESREMWEETYEKEDG